MFSTAKVIFGNRSPLLVIVEIPARPVSAALRRNAIAFLAFSVTYFSCSLVSSSSAGSRLAAAPGEDERPFSSVRTTTS